MRDIKEVLSLINFEDRNDTNRIEFIVIHYVGAVSTAKGNSKFFFGDYKGASAGYFVDEVETYRIVSDGDISWHCGTKGTYKHKTCRNTNSIGVEMCCKINSAGEWYFEPETIMATIELVKDLSKKYKVPKEKLLRHFDVTGKNCPEPFVRNPEEWELFKLKAYQEEETDDDMSKIEVKVLFNDTSKTLSGYNVTDKNFVGIRDVSELLGAKVGYDSSSNTVIIESEVLENFNCLYKIVQAEAGNQDENGKVYVTNVIMNRVKSPKFPNTIKEVVFQKDQFQPTRNGAYEKAIPDESTIKAVNKAMFNGDYSQGATYFRTISGATPTCWHETALTKVFDAGAHRFYK